MTISQNFPSIRPSLLLDFANTEQLDPRITFSRPTTATYYDNHTTAVAEQNLLLQSQTIGGTGWSLLNTTATANATTAPDGTTTASLIYPTTSGNNRWTFGTATYNRTTSGVSYTDSIYAKASGLNFLCFYVPTGSGVGAVWFNLSTGAVGTSISGFTGTITASANGYYRCTVTYSGTTGYVYSIWGGTDADNSITATTTGTNGVYLWGAQLEQRSTVTAYTPTTTAPITNYIPVLQTATSGQARFDHNPTTGESLGLLIEEQRTNLLTYSSDFSNVAWNKARCSITTASDISPEGLQTAQSLIEDTSTNSHPLYRSVASLTTATAYSFSVYAKPYGRTQMVLAASNTAFPTPGSVLFDISAGTVGTATGCTGAITSVGNGWYRCTMTITSGAAGTGDFYIQPATGGSASYTGNGYSGIYIWGSQLEAGAFATSYIPTVASQVTRSADSASMTGTNFSSWYNNAEGTLYAKADVYYSNASGTTVYGLASISDGSLNNDVLLYSYSNFIGYRVTDASSVQSDLSSGTMSANTAFQVAASYKVNSFVVSKNGATVVSDASGTVPRGMAYLDIGTRPITSSPVNTQGNYISGHISKLAYYPIAVTSAQLQALTGN